MTILGILKSIGKKQWSILKSKMNYTRWIYFESFINNILNLSENDFIKKTGALCNEIDFQIERIEKKTKSGYWGITEGDKVFISFMQQLKLRVSSKNRQEIKEVLADAELDSKKCLKVVFLCQETVTWPSFESLYHTIKSDSRFEGQLVYVPFIHPNGDENINYYDSYVNDYQLPMLMYDQYSLTKESPDIAVFIKPYDLIPPQYYIEEIDKVIKRCVYIPYAFFDMPTEFCISYGYRLLLHYKAWKIIAYSQKNYDFIKKYSYRNGENVAILGHPRFDISSGINAYEEDNITKQYKSKIKGRRVIGWNTHHGVVDSKDFFGAFLQYKDVIFEYFKKNKNFMLIWRPHPLLFQLLINEKIMSEKELQDMLNDLEEKDNIIIDRSKDYINFFALTDGLISDGGPSMTFEYTSTGKPIYYTVKNGGYIMPKDSIAECWYWMNSPNEVEDNLDNFFNKEDPMKNIRVQKSKCHIEKLDGKCGERIKTYIYEQLILEEKKSADYIFLI